jgi:hypothetical protein
MASMTVSVSEPSPDSGTGRCRALMMPWVTVLRRPSGRRRRSPRRRRGFVGIAELGHGEVVDVVDLQHRQVGLGIAADQVGGHFLAVVEDDRRLELRRVGGGVGDDVVVGDDVAAPVDDDAGALRASWSLTASMVTTESATEAATLANRPAGTSLPPLVDRVTLEVVNASTTSAVLRPTQPPAIPISSATMPRMARAT